VYRVDDFVSGSRAQACSDAVPPAVLAEATAGEIADAAITSGSIVATTFRVAMKLIAEPPVVVERRPFEPSRTVGNTTLLVL
jgi:hypothetical protein